MDTLPAIHYTGQFSSCTINRSINRWPNPPVRTTYTFMERKCALHLIFIPQRCHSFCSFNGFRQLGWNSGNAAFVCITETHWGICCKRVNTGVRFTVGHWLKAMCFSWSESNCLFLSAGKTQKKHLWCGLRVKAKTQKHNYISPLTGSLKAQSEKC